MTTRSIPGMRPAATPGLQQQYGAQPPDPYSSGISIPGTGANNSATNYIPQWDPQTGTYAIQGAAGQMYPIFDQAQYNNLEKDLPGNMSLSANFTPTSGTTGTLVPVFSTEAYIGATPAAPAGAGLRVQNPGGGSTDVGYKLDPTTGYMVPDSVRGIGQDSWWDNNWGLVGAAAVGGLGALAASGAAGAAGTGAAASGDTASLSDASLTSAASQLPQGATTLSDIGAPSFSTAGDSGITASQALQYARYGNTANSLAGNPLGLPGSGGNNMSVSSPAGGSNSPYNMGSLFNSNGGLNYGTALQGAGTAIGALLGNNANQATAGTLQGMYTNAANQAAPSVQAVNNTIQNPNTFFNSPYYKSLSSLYGNNVNATNNAAGNNGNNVTDQQKMMAFGNQQYDSYLNTIGGQAQGFLSNQAKYAPYNATGASLGNNSQSSMYGNLGNMLATGFGSALNSGSLSNLVTPQNSMFADSGALTGGEVDQMGLSSGTLGNQISQNAYDTSALSNTSYLDNLFGNG